MLLGKKSREKMILVLEKSLIFPKKLCMNHARIVTAEKQRRDPCYPWQIYRRGHPFFCDIFF